MVIKTKQERIKLYESSSLKSVATLLVKQAIFYSPQDAIAQEKSDLKVLKSKASMYEKSIANRKLLIEKLTLQRDHCQRILQQKIKSSTLEIHNIDNPALYDLEYKISKSYKLAGDEKTRLTQALGNTKRESKEYNLLTQNLEKISEAYNTCGQAQIATRNEIGRRLYTPEYIAFLQDTRAELTQQIYDGAADSDTQGLLDAVNTSLNNPMNINEVNIQLDKKTLNWLKDHGAETSDFNHFTGDPVGIYIFKKNIDTLLKARDLEFAHSSKAIARDCCQVVVNFGGAALDMVKDGLVQEAKRFTDIASAIYNLTHFTVNTAYGALEGSAEGCYAFATMCTHPVETIQKISGAIETIDDFVDRLFMLDPTAIDEAKTLGHTLIQSCKEFRQLPLDQKGYYIGKCIGFIWGPGAIAKGTKCLTALPKIQKGLTALSQMASTEMATLTQFAKNTATGVMLATKTSETELVTLGGKVMSKELAEAFTYAHSKIGGTLPLKDFISFVQKTQTPITQSFKRAFNTIEKMNALHIDPKAQSLLKIPYLIDEVRFEQVVTLLKENEIIKNIGGEDAAEFAETVVDKASKAVEQVTESIETAQSTALEAEVVEEVVYKSKDISISSLKIPQGIDQKNFKAAVDLIKNNEKIQQISGELFVHGSRAKGTAKITSDIDFGIRVTTDKFNTLIKECFGTPAHGSALERTMLNAIKTGKIQYGEIRLSGNKLGKVFKELLKNILGGIDVDLSIIRENSFFDAGPFIYT